MATRHALPWTVSVIWTQGGERYRMDLRVADLSLGGASLRCAYNLILPRSCKLFLSVPPHSRGSQSEMLEAECEYVYAVQESDASAFRMGLKFLHFKGDGLKALRRRLRHYRPS